MISYLIGCVFAFGFSVGLLMAQLLSFRKRSADEADERRKHFLTTGSPITPGVRHEYGWNPNSRGMLLFQQQYIPQGKLKGVVGFCHGYSECSATHQREVAMKFCARGFAVITYDAEGHGFSDGLHVYIKDLKDISGDASDYFSKQMKREVFQDCSFFILGESMGGAVSFNLSTLHEVHSIISGVVLVCPMVKVSDEMRPPQVVVTLLTLLAYYLPYAPLAPVPDAMEKAVKRADVLARMRLSPLAYHQLPRLATAVAMLNATNSIGNSMEALSLPLLILHGSADVVTDPRLSQELYDRCSSKDKEMDTARRVAQPAAGEEAHDCAAHVGHILDWIEKRAK
eukprot:CAMPEP_0173197928 /NCGR_PEP_ID=MMETSP1141-20130122/16421_1 /TAXON_ID=483371 /ORGANISM="non described non described, Strain CCMP2298" /LENGTH=340 /DNA_ID=CAMNT_0014122699 /DNA_START=143 /DNA_END=1166 /DNA_ORIENTATION=+